MSNRAFFVDRMKAELPAFKKVLAALPEEKLDYKPHERSPDARQLAWTLAAEAEACVDVLTKYQAEWKEVTPPPLAEMRTRFEKAWNDVTEKAAAMDDAGWAKKTQFLYGGKVVDEQPAGQFLWFILFDAIHHRGQLSAYLRPMGAKVPAIYGPSADEKG